MKLGAVGDIHGNYFGLEQAISEMGPIDGLLFTGDGIGDIRRLREMSDLPVWGVQGNCDFYSDFPEEVCLELASVSIFLTHGHLYRVKSGLARLAEVGKAKGAQLVVFGHTHQPLLEGNSTLILFNPGTLCEERSYDALSYGLVELDDRGIHPTLHRLAKCKQY